MIRTGAAIRHLCRCDSDVDMHYPVERGRIESKRKFPVVVAQWFACFEGGAGRGHCLVRGIHDKPTEIAAAVTLLPSFPADFAM